MAKKKTEKKGGKIAFVDELLQSGKLTKPQVAEKLNKEFGVNMKTAGNTVSWAASTMKERTGKVSKHLPTVKTEKAAKKVSVPKRTKKAIVATEAPTA